MSHNSAVEMLRRMTFGASPAIVFLTIISTALVAIGAYFWSVVDNLKIPITPGLPEVATFLPVANFIALKYLTKRPAGQPRGGSPPWSLQTGIIAILLVMLDTFVVTQSANNLPLRAISCPLERTWHDFYNRKDARSIKAVQDALGCCGLKTVKEQAWPFASRTVPADTCATTFGRDTPCFGPWSSRHQLSAGMFAAVAVVALMSKVVVFAVYRRRARTQQPPANQRLLGPGVEDGGSQIAGLRVRPDERIKYTDNDYGDEVSRLLEESESACEADVSRLLGEGSPSALPSGDDSIWRGERSRANPGAQGRS